MDLQAIITKYEGDAELFRPGKGSGNSDFDQLHIGVCADGDRQKLYEEVQAHYADGHGGAVGVEKVSTGVIVKYALGVERPQPVKPDVLTASDEVFDNYRAQHGIWSVTERMALAQRLKNDEGLVDLRVADNRYIAEAQCNFISNLSLDESLTPTAIAVLPNSDIDKGMS